MNPQNHQDTWDWLAAKLEDFLDAWENWKEGPPPQPANLPKEPVQRRMLLVELLKADIEYRLQANLELELESYLVQYPELAPLPTDLIFDDYRLRRTQGKSVSSQEYYDRFPDQADELRQLLALDLPEATMTLYRAARVPEFVVGEKVDDFILLSLLGEGSFAKVFLANQVSMRRMVALKISADRGSEPQTLAQLAHPNIVRVHDQKILPNLGVRLLYMEFAPGGTLHDVAACLRDCPANGRSGAVLCDSVRASTASSGIEPTLPEELEEAPWPRTVCQLGVQLAQALDFAHSRGVLHRDIKPANVLLGANGRAKLADFNISFNSQLRGAAPAAYFGGSLAYMSPEQLRACNVLCEQQAGSLDERSDLYSLAVVLWELLHGQRPFLDQEASGDWPAMLQEMTERREAGPPTAGEKTDAISHELQIVLTRCLNPSPDQRHATGDELARDLMLCMEPHARQLVHPQHGRLAQTVLRYPTLAVLAAVFFPNLLAGGLNLLFNLQWLSEQADHVVDRFWLVVGVINCVLYPIGVLFVAWQLRPMATALRRAASGEGESEEVCAARQRSLRIGPICAWTGFALWGIASVAYPVSLHLLENDFPWNGYLVFVIDLIACGLIAGAYPFFLTSLLSVRVIYPALLDLSDVPTDEAQPLHRLSSSTGVYLLIAAGVPMIAMLPLIFWGRDLLSHSEVALIGLTAAGLIGLVASWTAHRALQKDLDALCYAVRPIAPP